MTPFSIAGETIPSCKFDDSSPTPWIVFALTTQISWNSVPEWPYDLQGQGQRTAFLKPSESIPRGMFGADSSWHLVIPTQICEEFSRGRHKVYGRTERQTDREKDRQTARQANASNDNTPLAWKPRVTRRWIPKCHKKWRSFPLIHDYVNLGFTFAVDI